MGGVLVVLVVLVVLLVVVLSCPLLGLGLGGPRREVIGTQKDRRVEHHTNSSSLNVSC